MVGAVAVLAFAIQSIAWPLWAGRDAQAYLLYYLDMGSSDPVFPLLMVFRPPLTPLFFGSTLELGGPVLTEVLMGALYVLSILATYCIGAFWSRRLGLAAALVLAAYPSYGALYHNVSSDGLFAFGFVIWAVFICATAAAPTPKRFALHGVALFLLVLIRPSAQFFIPVFAALPFLLPGSMKVRIGNAVAFVVTAALLLAGFATYNSIRYEDFTISRMSTAQLPLYRLMSHDRLVDPSNGPASRELAQVIEADLLTREPYRSYDVTLHEFFNTGRIRMWADLAPLSDRTWGWDSDYSKLRAVALEAVRRHPWQYARGVARSTAGILNARYTPPPLEAPRPPYTIECGHGCVGDGYVEIQGRLLPEPREEGEPIPNGAFHWLQSRPDQSISLDWSSFKSPRFRFADEGTRRHYERLRDDVDALMSQLPSRDGSFALADALNDVTRLQPTMALWLLLGGLGLAFWPRRDRRILVVLCALGLIVVVGTALSTYSGVEYQVPSDPLFILFGLAGLFGIAHAARRVVSR